MREETPSIVRGLLVLPLFATLWGQAPTPTVLSAPEQWNAALKRTSGGMFSFNIEERTRWEAKTGVSFGKAVNQEDMLSRIRFGTVFKPFEWLRVSAMAQDSRVPFYGTAAPNTMRDTVDLQEAYIDLFANRERGFSFSGGRQMLNYGDTRVIGTPQWSNVARTYDYGRVSYRTATAKFEMLMVSPVKVRTDAFNVPDLGERIWGTYNTFSNVGHLFSVDLYALRHSQNKIGGFTGAGTLGTNSFGGRIFGGLPFDLKYSGEVIGQSGHIGVLPHRAYAWFAGVTRKVNGVLPVPVTLSADFKVATGSTDSSRSGTYDQLAPANHDKFGHEDLFGWRNLKTFRALETFGVTKTLAFNLLYSDHWLYSGTDALYNGQGVSIAVSKSGTAGTHVGRELDAFATYTKGAHQFGAGFGHFFKGEFVMATTPHMNPRYLYVFQQYSFK